MVQFNDLIKQFKQNSEKESQNSELKARILHLMSN